MSRRVRWGLLVSCCGLAALVAPSAWQVLEARPIGLGAPGAAPLAKAQVLRHAVEAVVPERDERRPLAGAAVAVSATSASLGARAPRRSEEPAELASATAPARVAR